MADLRETFWWRYIPYMAHVMCRSDGRKVWVFCNRDYQPIGRSDYSRAEKDYKSLRQLRRGYTEIDPDLDGIFVSPVMAGKIRKLAHRVVGRGTKHEQMWFYHDGSRDQVPELMRLLTLYD